VDASQALRAIRRLATRLSPEAAGEDDLRQFVREVVAVVDDVDTQSDLAPVVASAPYLDEPVMLTETLAELLRLGVVFTACTGCGKPRGACLSLPQCTSSYIELDAAALAKLAAVPTV